MKDQHGTDTKYARQTNLLGNVYDKRDPVLLCFSHGRSLSIGAVGKGSGQRGNFQDDFTRVFYSYRRYDWIPEWYQTQPK